MDVIADAERLTLLAEQDLLECVIELATVPGRIRRGDLDDLLLGVSSQLPVPGRPRLVPHPRRRPQV